MPGATSWLQNFPPRHRQGPERGPGVLGSRTLGGSPMVPCKGRSLGWAGARQPCWHHTRCPRRRRQEDTALLNMGP